MKIDCNKQFFVMPDLFLPLSISLSLSDSLSQITAIEPLVSYGGASANTQHLHQSLRWFFGVVAVVTDVGHVLLVDLCLDDFSCTQTELEASGELSIMPAPRVCLVKGLSGFMLLQGFIQGSKSQSH